MGEDMGSFGHGSQGHRRSYPNRSRQARSQPARGGPWIRNGRLMSSLRFAPKGTGCSGASRCWGAFRRERGCQCGCATAGYSAAVRVMVVRSALAAVQVGSGSSGGASHGARGGARAVGGSSSFGGVAPFVGLGLGSRGVGILIPVGQALVSCRSPVQVRMVWSGGPGAVGGPSRYPVSRSLPPPSPFGCGRASGWVGFSDPCGSLCARRTRLTIC